MANFWDFILLIISSFVLVAYLMIMFQIVTDLFRDSQLSGLVKALWLVSLIVLPMLTALVYVVARGSGMAERQRAAFNRSKEATEEYIRGVAGKCPAEQIAVAKSLLDSGAINNDEFVKLKAKALA